MPVSEGMFPSNSIKHLKIILTICLKRHLIEILPQNEIKQKPILNMLSCLNTHTHTHTPRVKMLFCTYVLTRGLHNLISLKFITLYERKIKSR